MKDKLGLDKPGGLAVVGHQTSDEMRVSRVQHAHQRVQGPPVHHSHGLEGLLPLLGSSGHAVGEQLGHEGHSGLPEKIQTVVVQGICVLGQPILYVVANNTCGWRS